MVLTWLEIDVLLLLLREYYSKHPVSRDLFSVSKYLLLNIIKYYYLLLLIIKYYFALVRITVLELVLVV